MLNLFQCGATEAVGSYRSGYELIQKQRSCRAPTRHLLPQQWDAPQTTLNHLLNPIVGVAKVYFAGQGRYTTIQPRYATHIVLT